VSSKKEMPISPMFYPGFFISYMHQKMMVSAMKVQSLARAEIQHCHYTSQVSFCHKIVSILARYVP
jgi:hypothetical protein